MLACSALKESYRQRLAQGVKDFKVVYLHASAELIRERMKARKHRYMPAALLDSQLATLEPPADAICRRRRRAAGGQRRGDRPAALVAALHR